MAPTPAAGCRDCGRLGGGGSVAAGDRLQLTYAGFGPGEQVTAVLHSTPVDLGTFTADASGVVTAPVTVPASLDAGAHTLVLTGAVSGERVLHFQLAAAAEPTSAARAVARPDSAGWGPVAWSACGAGLLVLAAGGLVLRRRRPAAGAAGAAVPAAQDRPEPAIG